MIVWDYLALLFAVLLIVAVALQNSQDDVTSAFSGEKSELFKNSKVRGLELFLMRFSAVVSVLFVAMIVISLLAHK